MRTTTGPDVAVAWRPVAAVAATVSVVLLASSGGYGFHRDELYFLEAGRHLAVGYPDQPALTPLIGRATTAVLGDTLVGLRVPSALAAGLVVLLAALTARELGAPRAAQVLAAISTAVGTFVLAVGHTLSTSTFDLLAGAAVVWLALRAVRDGGRVWLALGVVAGVGLENKSLVALVLGALLAGVLVAGPRHVLRGPGPWLAGLIAVVLWLPYLIWQAAHGWPQLDLAAGIAGGGSLSSEPRWAVLPFQVVLIGPLLAPIWLAGLWRLARDRDRRFLAVAWAVVLVVLLVAGGKPYYLAAFYPVLLAAGAEPALRWARTTGRRVVLAVALVLTGAVSATIVLPVVPVSSLAATPVTDLYPDAGETVGWPALVDTVAAARARVPGATVIVTANYGQAGAIDRFGPGRGLPGAFSPHASYGEWGPPPETAAPVLVVGFGPEQLDRWCGRATLLARVDNGVGLENEEQGTPVWSCEDRRVPWAVLWPSLRRLV